MIIGDSNAIVLYCYYTATIATIIKQYYSVRILHNVWYKEQ